MNPAPKRILLVDSQASEAGALLWQFPRECCSVTYAGDYSEAMNLVSGTVYDLALIEIDLPRRNSMNLLRKLRREQPATRVFMFTDYGDEELWVDVVNEGACDLLTRPSITSVPI